MISANRCAKAIVNSTKRGDKYFTTPSWMKTVLLWKELCPEIFNPIVKFLFISWPTIYAKKSKITQLKFNSTYWDQVPYSDQVQASEFVNEDACHICAFIEVWPVCVRISLYGMLRINSMFSMYAIDTFVKRIEVMGVWIRFYGRWDNMKLHNGTTIGRLEWVICEICYQFHIL